MKTTYFSPAIFEISTSLFFSPGVPIIIIMTLIDPLPPADAVYFKKEIKITPINLLNSIWHKVVYSSFLLCIVQQKKVMNFSQIETKNSGRKMRNQFFPFLQQRAILLQTIDNYLSDDSRYFLPEIVFKFSFLVLILPGNPNQNPNFRSLKPSLI